jgi:hypothetical protein
VRDARDAISVHNNSLGCGVEPNRQKVACFQAPSTQKPYGGTP